MSSNKIKFVLHQGKKAWPEYNLTNIIRESLPYCIWKLT